MRGGDIHGRTFVILCNASMKINGQSTAIYTLIYTYTDISRYKSKDLLTYDAKINRINADQLFNRAAILIFERCDVYVRTS